MQVSKYSGKLLELRRKASREWKARNKEHVKAKLAAWTEKNKEKRAQYHSERWRSKKEELQKRKADRYYSPGNIAMREAYKETAKEKNAEWRRNHPGYASQQHRDRRAKKLKIPIENRKISNEWEYRWRKSILPVRCYWCCEYFEASTCHVDHIIPLKRGGPHEIGNLCIACGPCNLRKNRKTLERWNSQITQPVLF